jgi:ATP phosphoribosyltransferase
MSGPLVIAVPKGRILEELAPFFSKAGIEPEASFYDEHSRALQFASKDGRFSLIRVRSFDVPTFVAFGAAQIGIAGSDVLMEFGYDDVYTPLDLGIGKCRLSIAQPENLPIAEDLSRISHVRVATKYPNITRRYFADQGIQAECIKLSGAMELAPKLGLTQRIVDLVSTGKTLKANGLVEVKTIADISSRLIVHRAAFKTRSAEISDVIERFREAVNAA